VEQNYVTVALCIFCCGSHSVEQSSCRIQRPDNQRCLLPTAFKDSSVRTTASAPQCLARARFVYDYALCKFTFIIIIIIIINVALLDDPLQSIPRQLAVPWYEVSRHVGVPPASSVANTSLNNWRLIDPDRHAALFVTSSVTAAASVSYNTIRYEVLF